MKRRIAFYALGVLFALGLAHCGGTPRAKAVTIKGSDTMVILGQRWAEAYMAAHPGKVIQVTGGGSGTGIAALINGTTDICQSSRSMKDDERAQLAKKNGHPPTETIVARDSLTIYVNVKSTIHELSLAQIRGIYSGTIHNWKEVGGPDAPITAYGRENNSGTYAYFKEHVLENGDFAANIQTLPGTAAVVNAVAQDVNGIGYGGAAYAKGVTEVGVKANDQSPAVLPTADNVKTGAYPIARGLYYYTAQEPAGDLKEFMDFALSPEGQKLVSEVGYFPL